MPAWAQQRGATVNGKFNPALEKRLSRRTPGADFVFHGRDHENGASGRAVRGYNLMSAVDIATGLVLSFHLGPATSHEPTILREKLLPTLFTVMPDLEVTSIVGDAKYDDAQTHEHLETRYGIHLVATRKAHALSRRGRMFTELDHPSVRGVGGDGIAICRAHNLRLPYAGMWPTRRPVHLRPGEPVSAAAIRSRFVCEMGCGKVSIATQACWSNLPYFPFTPFGRLDLFARRRALLHRRNQVEAVFSSLQVGYKQCLDGAARVRLHDQTVNEALIGLSNVTRAFLALHAERLHRGEFA
jgi:hypothetical protein